MSTVRTPKTSAPAHPSREQKRLALLEERYRHEFLDVEERYEFENQVLRLRRKLSC